MRELMVGCRDVPWWTEAGHDAERRDDGDGRFVGASGRGDVIGKGRLSERGEGSKSKTSYGAVR